MRTAEEILMAKGRELICIAPDSTVMDAVKKMADEKIGSILICDGEVILGIYTERDLLMHSAQDDFDPRTVWIKDVMTTDLLFAHHDASVYKLQDIALGTRCRHILIVKDGQYIGMLSAGDLTRAVLNEKSRELKSVSWDYYEDWSWKRGK